MTCTPWPGCASRRYQPGASANGWDHPVSWCRDYDGGRSFYTGMGGTVAVVRRDATSVTHLRGALLWTTRLAQADCKATINANYKAERLTQPNQPRQTTRSGSRPPTSIGPPSKTRIG